MGTKNKSRSYFNELMGRALSVTLIIIVAYCLHKLFVSINNDIAGAFIFIVIFTSGLFFYYIKLFNENRIHNIEFLISIVLIFILTIVMFSLIYVEPSGNSIDSFKVSGQTSNLGFSDALYFSTATITTMGADDITPLGVFRYYVMLEVLMGLIYMGLIVYFITKALDKK